MIERIDFEDLAIFFVSVGSVFLVLFLFCFAVLAPIHFIFYSPAIAENAQTLCVERGLDMYSGYEEKLFSTKPYGLKCINVNSADNNYGIAIEGLGD